MAKYRKKPVVVEARQATFYYDDATRERHEGNIYELVDWINKSGGTAKIDHDPCGDFGILIKTLEGEMYVTYKDYVIQGVQGEFYPCKPTIFDETYDAVPA